MTRAIKVEKRCRDCPYLVTIPWDTNHCTLARERIDDIKIIAPFCPLPPWPSVTRKWVADQAWSLWNFDGAYKKSERKLHDEKNAGLIAAVVEVLRRAGVEVSDE